MVEAEAILAEDQVEKGGKFNMNFQNVCIKCGKQRVVGSVVEEKINNSVVSYKEMICPDPECQKRVMDMLEREDRKRKDALLLKTNSKRPIDIKLGPKEHKAN